MKVTIINAGVVANCIEIDSLASATALFPTSTCVAGSATIGYLYDGTNFTKPPVDLVAYKAAKNQQINTWRLTANLSTFPYAGKQIACDTLSRSDIDAVAGAIALTGAFPANFPNTWKATDNTLVPVPDIATFKAMYAAMAAQGTANFARSQSLKAALAAANTQADIDAIVW